MTEDEIKAMNFQRPRSIPVKMRILPAAWMKYREALDEIARRHPMLFDAPAGPRDYDAIPSPRFAAGQSTDAWGCVWSNVYPGHTAIVTGHPLPRREDVRRLRAPAQDIGLPHGFMFLRLTDLRGYEEMMIDFAEEPPELQMLIGIVLEYNLRQVRIAVEQSKPGDLIAFADDLGTQHALPISPATWRKYLKPCYSKLAGLCRRAGHPVYLHTDGHIHEIIPDLVECGVSVVNPQVRANGLEHLARVCKGKVCVDLDLDRQLFPFCTPADIASHVRDAVEALGSPEGGLWLKAEVDDGVPLENIEAIACALEGVSR